MSPDDQRSSARLRVLVTDDRGRSLRRPGLSRWLQTVAPARTSGEVSVALVSDRVMRRMNLDYAGHDYATDVLSFSAREGEPPPSAESARQVTTPRGAHRERASGSGVSRRAQYLGDIVIATGVAARQARDAGHGVATELRILALHGLLHLLGYDHVTDAGEMGRLEARLRRKGGLNAGLIERSRRRRS